MVIFNSYVKLPEGIHHTDLKNMILNMRWMTTWMTTTHRQCFDHGTYDHQKWRFFPNPKCGVHQEKWRFHEQH